MTGNPLDTSHWPAGVESLGVGNIDRLGRHRKTNELYWDGQKLVTERRLANFERVMVFIATFSTAVGAIAAVAQVIIQLKAPG
jgi:hypothetical protein